jgi:hypothetical protein
MSKEIDFGIHAYILMYLLNNLGLQQEKKKAYMWYQFP